MQKLFIIAATAALFATVAQPSMAASLTTVTDTTTQIGGNATIKATVNGAQTNFANGNNNIQRNSVCTTYEGTRINGNRTSVKL